MMVILRPNTKKEEIDKLSRFIEDLGVEVQYIQGKDTTILGLAGDTTGIDPGIFERFEFVERTMKVAEPYKRANRKFHLDDTVIQVKDRTIGGKKLAIMAGPCSIESEDQIDRKSVV